MTAEKAAEILAHDIAPIAITRAQIHELTDTRERPYTVDEKPVSLNDQMVLDIHRDWECVVFQKGERPAADLDKRYQRLPHQKEQSQEASAKQLAQCLLDMKLSPADIKELGLILQQSIHLVGRREMEKIYSTQQYHSASNEKSAAAIPQLETQGNSLWQVKRVRGELVVTTQYNYWLAPRTELEYDADRTFYVRVNTEFNVTTGQGSVKVGQASRQPQPFIFV